MGSGTSKSVDSEAAAEAAGHRRSYSRSVFRASCIRSPDTRDIDDEQVSNCAKETTSKLKRKTKRKNVVQAKETDKTTYASSETQFGELGVSRNGSTSSQNPSSRFLSRCSFFPGNVSLRLSRATSSRSSRAYPESSTSSISNDEEIHSNHFGDKSKTSHGCEFFPSCFMPRSPEPWDDDLNSENSEISSVQELVTNTNVESNGNQYDDMERRRVDRRNGAREPVERISRFSRTLSVGRLRDRVLRRPAFPELPSCPMQPEREVLDATEARGIRSNASNENTNSSSDSLPIMSGSLYGTLDSEVQNARGRETRYQDISEHSSNFHERRRRIRSQVRALQRMGSRFENLSGHERSCILSSQHRTGQCACRHANRDPNDSTNPSASISRVVLLAEALFEVLDEIHQQSVILSSQASLSSIGSIPAPDDVVETLPVKLYCKSPKHLKEDESQCYICLVEYTDGDEIRILPCHHEFHRLCIDKWLKEIHRICPLCRGDVCKPESLSAAATS